MVLPIKKVVLYKHGVGYFERAGDIEGDASLDLYFKAAEMNDVLKSLTTLDLGGGLIASVSYESTKPIERQLEDISIRLPDENSITALLAQVKGARVAVEVGQRRIEGVVTGLETVTRKEGDTTLFTHALALLVNGSSLESFELAAVRSLTFLDDNVKKDLEHLLSVLISAKKKDLKKLTIFAKGEGKRGILASYTIETPVWKTSYRVLLRKEKPLIQGWAVIDNTQDEDWDDVELTLVAGLPISFVHDLYSPRYKRRPVVQVREEEAYAPPELEAPVEAMSFDMAADPFAMPMGAPVPPPAPAMAAPGGGMARASMKSKGPGTQVIAKARAESVKVQTRTVEVGDLFQYEIENPVTVKRNQSALVPILQGEFDGKRVAVYNQDVRDKNPLSAVLFKNTTGMTLEGGPVTVLEDETYVGEAMLDTMKPAEERLVPFSVELGCVVTIDHRSDLADVREVRIANGWLSLSRWRTQRRIYVVTNKGEKTLDLFLEHRFNHGYDLVETPEPVEKTENFYRFRFDAPAKKTIRFTVSERHDEQETHEIASVNRDQIRYWIESRYIDDLTRRTLETLAEISDKAAALGMQAAELEREVQEIFQNQERLRKNLASLGQTADERGLRERYVGELTREEDKLRELRATIKKARDEKARLDRDLAARVASVSFAAKLA